MNSLNILLQRRRAETIIHYLPLLSSHCTIISLVALLTLGLQTFIVQFIVPVLENLMLIYIVEIRSKIRELNYTFALPH